MNAGPEHPSRDELLVMAYVDDELAPEQRRLFQERLAGDPELNRQVCAYRELALLATRMAPAEPGDLEWNRIRSSPLHRGSVGLGWTLLALGGLLFLGWSAVLVLDSDLGTVAKWAISVPAFSFFWLLLIRLRNRRRLVAYDPYTEVRR